MIEPVKQNVYWSSSLGGTSDKNYYISYRYHKSRESERKEALRSFVGATIGTIVPMAIYSKKQNVNLFKLKYGLKELIGVSAGAIAGGVLAGMFGENKQDKIQKIKEGVFQLFNATIPPVFVSGLLSIASKTETFNNKALRIISTVLGLVSGMYVAAKLSNFVCDPKDKAPDRKLTIKDSIANVDDALGILALSNNPVISKLPISQVLPFIYILCGYRAGSSN